MIACADCGLRLDENSAYLVWLQHGWYVTLIPELNRTRCFECKIAEGRERLLWDLPPCPPKRKRGAK